MLTTKQTMDFHGELINYIKETGIASYYELKTVAYTEKFEWIPFFEDAKFRTFLSDYLRSKMRMLKYKSKKPLHQLMEESLSAEIEYYKNHQELPI